MQDLEFSAARVTQVRIARPTDRLEEVVAFYRDGLGLPELTRFKDHAGYDGVMLGLPGSDYHLEFTSHADGSPCPAPSIDNLLEVIEACGFELPLVLVERDASLDARLEKNRQLSPERRARRLLTNVDKEDDRRGT